MRAGEYMRELKAGRESDQPGKQWISELRSPLASILIVQGFIVGAAITRWLVVSPKSELRPPDEHGQLFPLSYTACYKTPGGEVCVWGCQAQGPSLLHCWATEHTGRSYFPFHLQSSPAGINWLHIKPPWGAFKKSGCPEPTPGPWTQFLGVRPSTLCF